MAIDTVNALLIAIAFLVPGFILSSVLAMRFRRRSRSPAEMMLQFLTFSCVNYGFWSPLIVVMIQGNWLEQRLATSAILVFVMLFVSPLAAGLIASGLSRKHWVQRLLAAFGFMVHRFIPTAWDFNFARETPSWVIVRLKDGSSVYGFFGNQSFAGDDPEERDLFIEAVFQPTEKDAWQPVVDTEGILIKAGEIATIEFRRIDDTQGTV